MSSSFSSLKSKFCDNFKTQVIKLNQFLQTWAKEFKVVEQDPLKKLVIEFSPD